MNEKYRKEEADILILDKIYCKTKAIKTDKEGYYLMIKGSIQDKDIAPVNIYAPNIGAPRYIQQMLTAIKGESDGTTVTAGDLTPHTHQWTGLLDRKSIRQQR